MFALIFKNPDLMKAALESEFRFIDILLRYTENYFYFEKGLCYNKVTSLPGS